MIAFEHNLDRNLARLSRALENDTWRIHGYNQFIAYEHGKRRVIDWDPCFEDNVVHHAIEQTAGRILLRSMIRDTYAGIRGRGCLDGANRTRLFLASYPAQSRIYICQMDVHHFYPSIDHDVLKAKLARKIKDRRVLHLFDIIIDSHSPGLPIGNYLSQLLANFYLSDYDHWIKARRIKHYCRYCDDIVLIHSDKDVLRAMMHESSDRLKRVEHLEIKHNYQVYPIERSGGLNFLGYVFSRHRVRLRKRIERHFRHAVHLWRKYPCIDILRTIGSYWGWLKWLSHGSRLWEKFFGVNFKTLYKNYMEIKK